MDRRASVGLRLDRLSKAGNLFLEIAARSICRNASSGLIILDASCRLNPRTKRAICFIDGQNLFHAARESFGYTYPNYDVQALSRVVCRGQGWNLAQVCFYTGIHSHTRKLQEELQTLVDSRWKDGVH